MTAPLMERLGISVPIIQAPMAGSQDSRLAAAVSNAGGLGSLPAAMLSLEQLATELETIHAATDRPYNVNFFCHREPDPDPAREVGWRSALAPYYAEFGVDADAAIAAPARVPFDTRRAELLARFRPPVVSFHFGLPDEDALARVKTWNPVVISSATTVEEARWLERRGVDLIVAQGLEAGGHRGIFLSEDLTTQTGTMALVPQIVRAVRVPVVAAGGITDRAQVAAALALGAAGVQVGTAFLRAPEATTTALHRAALAGDGAGHTALTNLFTGRPARGIVNRLIRELGPLSPLAPAFPLAVGALIPIRAKAEAAGRDDFSPLWAGQAARLCRAAPAADILADLAGSAVVTLSPR
ncbi:MAG: nitronate monooxygenase [Gemmatimonadetes bacterium]|nr:nitronate monooxygenase [Gemmatimonadota bacterium]